MKPTGSLSILRDSVFFVAYVDASLPTQRPWKPVAGFVCMMRSAGATRPDTVFHQIDPDEPKEWSSDKKKPLTIRRAIGPPSSCKSDSVTEGGPASGASRCHHGVSLSAPAFSPIEPDRSGDPASIEGALVDADAYGLSLSVF